MSPYDTNAELCVEPLKRLHEKNFSGEVERVKGIEPSS